MPDFPGRLKTPRLTAAPATPTVGEMYFNTTQNVLYWWNGSTWISASGSSLAIDDSNLPPRLQTTGPTITDFNSPKASGWYRPNNATNGPAGATPYGMLHHEEWDGGNGHAGQLFWPMYDNHGSLWFRICETHVWQSWRKLSPVDNSNLPARLNESAWQNTVSDANNALQNGWWGFPNGCTNVPRTGTDFYCQVYDFDGSYCVQIAYNFYQYEVWYRYKTGAWSAWTKMFPIDDAVLPSRLKSTSNFTGDWNAATKSGFYEGGMAANAPTAGVTYNYWMGYVSSYDETSGHTGQLLINLFEDLVFYRRQASGSWGAWKRIFPADATTDANLPARIAGGTIYVGDLNAVYENGWYPWSGGTANTPVPGFYGYCYVQNLGAGNVLQLAYRYNYDDAYMRRRWDSGAWGPWIQTWPVSASNSGPTAISMVNDWYQLSGQDPPTSTRAGNIVTLSGVVYKPSSTVSGPPEHMGWLVAGHRPQTNIFGIAKISGGYAEISIRNDGAVFITSWNGNPSDGGGGGWVSFSGITYAAYN